VNDSARILGLRRAPDLRVSMPAEADVTTFRAQRAENGRGRFTEGLTGFEEVQSPIRFGRWSES
jgi:hypothetical protein